MAGETAGWRPSSEMAAWMEQRAEHVHAAGGLSARTRAEMEMWRTVQAADLARHGWTLEELQLVAHVLDGIMVTGAIPTGPRTSELSLGLQDFQPQSPADEELQATVAARATDMSASEMLALEHAIAQWRADGGESSARAWAAVGVRVAG